MKERSFDEMIAYFNRRVSEMDIAQNYKIELLGMVTALGYKHKKTAQQWIPCSKQEYPSDNREVEVTCEFTRYDGKKIRYTCHASYVHRYSIETVYGNWEDCEEYNEEKDMCYALPGWYERVHNWDDYSYCAIEDRVVAWRELSEPWKGEQQ